MTGTTRRLIGRSLVAVGNEESAAQPDGVATGQAGEARVVATGIRKAYGRQVVLRDVDLRLARRSLIAVAGNNGVGKSTLLSCLAGTIAHGGSVLLDGVQVGAATRGRLAYLPQRLRLPASASGREVMKLFGALAAGSDDRIHLPDGFLPPLDKPLGQLSGGQAQRVALAAVLQGAPDLVLLDEPFANLDDAARDDAHALLKAHRDAGATVLIASPTALDLLAMIDRVLLVEDARIVFDGAPAGYAGRLEVTVWIRDPDVPEAELVDLPHVLRTKRESDWVALDCHEDRAIGLLRDLDRLGIPPERVRLGGPAADARLSASPGPPGEARR